MQLSVYAQKTHLVLESLEVVEHGVAEAVVERLGDQRGCQVAGAHPGEGAPQRRGVVGRHGAQVVVEGRAPVARRFQPVHLIKNY